MLYLDARHVFCTVCIVWESNDFMKPIRSKVAPSFSCRYVLKELIETEKMYVGDLGLIVEVSHVLVHNIMKNK